MEKNYGKEFAKDWKKLHMVKKGSTKKFNMKPEEALIVTLDGKDQIFLPKERGKRMYKELVISAIVAIVILGLNTITQNYTKNAVEQMKEKLDKTRQELVKEEADFETAKKASKKPSR